MRRLVLLLCVACTLQTDGTERVQIVSLDESRVYSPVEAEVEVLSVDPLASPQFRFFIGGDANVSGTRFLIEGEAPLTPRVERSLSSVLAPTDYVSLLAFCALHHLQQARDYADSLGLEEVEQGLVFDVYLRLRLELGGRPFEDNMAYVRGEDAFVVPPEAEIDSLPLACNAGVVMHEYAHAIGDHLGEPGPIASLEAQAVSEGFSDIFAAGFLNLPHYIDMSLPDLNVRRLDMVRIDNPEATSPYIRGSVLASVYWAYREARVEQGLSTQEASDEMVSLATRVYGQLRRADAVDLEAFVLTSIGQATDSDAFCERAQVSYPTGAVAAACAP